MPQNFIASDRDQPLLLPPDLRDWLEDDHLAWFVIDAVAALDLEPFYSAYRADGHGAAAHDPQMMVTLFAYAYCQGIRSSREIERHCREDVAFRVICANRVPDHATIARFRVRHEDALADLFTGVLGLCAKAGIIDPTVIAVDGSKIRANASDGARASYEQIAAEIVAEAGRIDAVEDEIHGEARGDELPPELRTREGREGWISAAKEQLEREREANPEPVPRDRAERLERCRGRLVKDWRAERFGNRVYDAYRRHGRTSDGRRLGGPSKPHEPPATPRGEINVTDPDAKRLKVGPSIARPAYNAQAVTTEDQLIVAAEITTVAIDTAHLAPMMDATDRELKAAGVTDEPEVVLADAGYWSNRAIDALRLRGTIPLVAVDSNAERPRKTRQGPRYDFMRRAINTGRGAELYAKRRCTVEPVFGQIKSNRRIDRFKRRGRAAVRSEWRLIAATHNLLKLHRAQLAAAAG